MPFDTSLQCLSAHKTLYYDCTFLKVIVLLLWVISVSYTDRNCTMFYGGPSAFTEIAIPCVSTLNKTPVAI